MQIIHVHWVLLANAVSSVLCLLHNTRCPSKFSKDYSWRSCKSDALTGSCDWEYRYSDVETGLKLIHTLVTCLWSHFTINADRLDTFTAHESFQLVKHLYVVRKNEEFCSVFKQGINEIFNAIKFCEPWNSVGRCEAYLLFLILSYLNHVIIKIAFLTQFL